MTVWGGRGGRRPSPSPCRPSPLSLSYSTRHQHEAGARSCSAAARQRAARPCRAPPSAGCQPPPPPPLLPAAAGSAAPPPARRTAPVAQPPARHHPPPSWRMGSQSVHTGGTSRPHAGRVAAGCRWGTPHHRRGGREGGMPSATGAGGGGGEAPTAPPPQGCGRRSCCKATEDLSFVAVAATDSASRGSTALIATCLPAPALRAAAVVAAAGPCPRRPHAPSPHHHSCPPLPGVCRPRSFVGYGRRVVPPPTRVFVVFFCAPGATPGGGGGGGWEGRGAVGRPTLPRALARPWPPRGGGSRTAYVARRGGVGGRWSTCTALPCLCFPFWFRLAGAASRRGGSTTSWQGAAAARPVVCAAPPPECFAVDWGRPPLPSPLALTRCNPTPPTPPLFSFPRSARRPLPPPTHLPHHHRSWYGVPLPPSFTSLSTSPTRPPATPPAGRRWCWTRWRTGWAPAGPPPAAPPPPRRTASGGRQTPGAPPQRPRRPRQRRPQRRQRLTPAAGGRRGVQRPTGRAWHPHPRDDAAGGGRGGRVGTTAAAARRVGGDRRAACGARLGEVGHRLRGEGVGADRGLGGGDTRAPRRARRAVCDHARWSVWTGRVGVPTSALSFLPRFFFPCGLSGACMLLRSARPPNGVVSPGAPRGPRHHPPSGSGLAPRNHRPHSSRPPNHLPPLPTP